MVFCEVKEGQLPRLMKLLDALSLRQALAVREVVAASDEEVEVWYGEGTGDPRVHQKEHFVNYVIIC